MHHAQQTYQSKAKDNVAAMNDSQQTYQSQHKTFADSVVSLGIDVPTQSDTYDYSIQISDRAVFNYGISQQDKLKSYVGGVFSIPATDFNLKANPKEIITMTILCEAESAGDLQLANPTYENGEIACGVGTVESLE
jgi:lipopolysaccharide assembly outer membrane protein LptD (OstA)